MSSRERLAAEAWLSPAMECWWRARRARRAPTSSSISSASWRPSTSATSSSRRGRTCSTTTTSSPRARPSWWGRGATWKTGTGAWPTDSACRACRPMCRASSAPSTCSGPTASWRPSSCRALPSSSPFSPRACAGWWAARSREGRWRRIGCACGWAWRRSGSTCPRRPRAAADTPSPCRGWAWVCTSSELLRLGGAGEVVADDLSALHDEAHAPQLAHIRERIPRDGDEVSITALLQNAHVLGEAEQFRGARGGRADGLDGGQPRALERDDLPGFLAMGGGGTRVEARDDLHAERLGLLHHLADGLHGLHAVLTGGLGGGLLREHFHDAQGGDEVRPLLLHHLERGAVRLVPVLDGVRAREQRVADALAARGMHGDLALGLVRLLGGDADLLDGEGGVAPVGVDLEQVRALAQLLPRGAADFLDAAHHARAGGEVRQVGRDAEGVVLAHGGDALGGHEHAGPLDEPLADGVAQGHVRVARALVLHVAHGGVARAQRGAGVGGALQRAEGLGLGEQVPLVLHALGRVREARQQGGMGGHEAGQQRGLAQVDDARSLGDGEPRAHCAEAG